MKKEQPGIKIIAKNKKVFFNYLIGDKFEAGIVLTGSEIKSIREGGASLADSYALIKEGEAFLVHAHIAQYAPASILNHEPRRTRKLLLHSKEILRLDQKLREKGLTLVPTMIYFKKGRAKVELALARGKKKYDKREAIRRKEDDRKMSRALKR